MMNLKPTRFTRLVDAIRNEAERMRAWHKPGETFLGVFTKEELAKKHKVKTSHVEQALRVLNREGFVSHAQHYTGCMGGPKRSYGWRCDHYRVLPAKEAIHA